MCEDPCHRAERPNNNQLPTLLQIQSLRPRGPPQSSKDEAESSSPHALAIVAVVLGETCGNILGSRWGCITGIFCGGNYIKTGQLRSVSQSRGSNPGSAESAASTLQTGLPGAGRQLFHMSDFLYNSLCDVHTGQFGEFSAGL